MQNQIMNWPTAAVEIGKILLPVLIPIVITYLTLRHQRELEKVKTDGQLKLEARKLMFNSYQQELERSNESFRELGKTLGGLAGEVWAAEDEDEKRKVLHSYMGMMKLIISVVREAINGMKRELEERGLLVRRGEQLAVIENFLAFDLTKASTDELEKHQQDAHRAMTLISALQSELLKYRRDEMFADYLPISHPVRTLNNKN